MDAPDGAPLKATLGPLLMKPSFEYRWGFAIIGGPICASLIVTMVPEAKPAFWLVVVMCSVLGYMFGRFYMDRDAAYPEESAIDSQLRVLRSRQVLIRIFVAVGGFIGWLWSLFILAKTTGFVLMLIIAIGSAIALMAVQLRIESFFESRIAQLEKSRT